VAMTGEREAVDAQSIGHRVFLMGLPRERREW